MKIINLADFQISNNNQFILIAGPCVIESEQHS
jgi:3-deoxy-D-manno-octulosonic acid (KDO) 8-phosphate synthase